jgi:flagellar biosynthesis protein FliR
MLENVLSHTALVREYTNALLVGGLVLARVGTAIWIAPFLGGRLVPGTVKTGTALALTLAISPQIVSSQSTLWGAAPLVLAALLFKEALVGMALGFVAALIFLAIEASGRLVDTARGANLAEVLVPQLGGRSSPLGDLYFQLALVLFISLGGHRIFITALGASYSILPLTGIPAVTGLKGFAVLCCRLSAEFFIVALAFSAPILVALFLADLALGVMGRFVPSLNVFFVAMPLKALLGIAVLVLSVSALAAAMPELLDAAMQQVSRTLRIL